MAELDDPNGAQSGDVNGAQSGTGSSDAGNTGGTDAGAQSGTTPPADTVSRADFDRIQAQLRAADQKRAEVEKAHRDLIDKDLPAQEKLTKERDEATARADALQTEVIDLRKANAFLTDNTYEWQNPEIAQALLAKTGISIEIDSSGTVTGLKEALKKLATDHPYLLKTVKTEETPPAGGTVPGNNGKGGTDSPARKTLEGRFGALRTRR